MQGGGAHPASCAQVAERQRRLHLAEHDGDALVERGNRGGDGLGPLDHLEREGQPLLRQPAFAFRCITRMCRMAVTSMSISLMEAQQQSYSTRGLAPGYRPGMLRFATTSGPTLQLKQSG